MAENVLSVKKEIIGSNEKDMEIDNKNISEYKNSARDFKLISNEDSTSTGSGELFPLSGRSSQSSRGRSSHSSFNSLSEISDYTIVEHEFVPGYRQNSKILYAEEQFYQFNTKSSLGTAYLCVNKNCNARLYIVVTNQCIRLANCTNHNHETKFEEYKKLRCLNEIKRRCGELKYMLTGQQVSVRDIFNDVMLQNLDVSLDFFQHERTLHAIRADALPKNPTTCSEILDAFGSLNIMNSIGRSQHLGNPIFFNGLVEEKGYSFCVFSSKYIMDLIEKHIDVKNRYYLMDGTFKVVPVGPFNQLLIFYINYIDKAYPFINVLMSQKTEACYSHVLRFIEEKVFTLLPSKITTDYENAMRNALKIQYPAAKFIACWFHFTQAVKRNASKMTGFVNFFRINDKAQNLYYKLMSLPLLPAHYIKPTFEILKLNAFAIDERKFVRFINYYEKQWIENERPYKISVFGENIRITASVEAYNNTLGNIMNKKGNFYRFVVSLNKQEYMKSMEMEHYIASGGLTGYKRKRVYKDRNENIKEASDQLTAGTILPMDFLNRVLHNESKLRQDLSDFSHVDTSESAEIDQFEFLNEVQESQNENEVPERKNPDLVLHPTPSTSQAKLYDDSLEGVRNDSRPPVREGTCIICMTNMANVLFFDCKHLATCELCHSKIKQEHIENCKRRCAVNERKLNRELSRVKCPKCKVIYKKAEVIILNSFN